MTTDWYAPNQQAVRADESGPAEEGTGGTGDPGGGVEPEPQDGGSDLDAMTKDELLAVAQDRGLRVGAQMTKAEIREAIDTA